MEIWERKRSRDFSVLSVVFGFVFLLLGFLFLFLLLCVCLFTLFCFVGGWYMDNGKYRGTGR